MTTKLFFMAALALTFAACSNDDNDFENPAQQPAEAQGIPFTATISMGGDKATTRALSETESGLTATWAEGEEVALIHNGIIDKVTVASVDGNVATISGTITSDADGAAVTVIFPYSAVDLDTKDVKADLLYTQSNGTLADVAAKYDVRKGTGTLKVSGTASLNDDVTLNNQFAIFKFTTKNSDASATIDVTSLTVTIGSDNYVITPASATSELYVALPPISSQAVTFTATDGSNLYTASKASVTFAAGKYYQSTLKMAVVPSETITFSGGQMNYTYYGTHFSVSGMAEFMEGFLMVYKGLNMTIAATDGKTITKVVFNYKYKANLSNLTFSSGNFDGDSTVNNVNATTLTVGSNITSYTNFSGVTIYYSE